MNDVDIWITIGSTIIGVLATWFYSRISFGKEARATARSAMRRVYDVIGATNDALDNAKHYYKEAQQPIDQAHIHDLIHQLHAILRTLSGFELDWKDVLAKDFEEQTAYESDMLSAYVKTYELQAKLKEMESLPAELEQEKGKNMELKKNISELKNQISEERRKALTAEHSVPFPVGTAAAMPVKGLNTLYAQARIAQQQANQFINFYRAHNAADDANMDTKTVNDSDTNNN